MSHPCIVSGCTRPALSRTFCRAHQRRADRGQPLSPPIRKRRSVAPEALLDHPLLEELLDLIEPEMRPGEGVLSATKRMIQTCKAEATP